MNNDHQVTYLGDGLCLVRTQWQGHVVVPTYNVDVAVGIIRDGIHEPWTTRLIQESLREGDVYINVGANFGYYASLGGKIVGAAGKVLAFEANPHVFSILLKTIMYAGFPDRTSAYNRAVYNATGSELEFSFDYQFAGGGHLALGIGQESETVTSSSYFWDADSVAKLLTPHGKWLPYRRLHRSFKAATLALDTIPDVPSANLIHCDAEGAEPYILLGAEQLIRRSDSLRIVFEWAGKNYHNGTADYQESSRAMWNMLLDSGFQIQRLMPFVHPDGGIEFSPKLDFDSFIEAPHGDYLATRMS